MSATDPSTIQRPAPTVAAVGPNVGIVEMTTRSDHDGIADLKDTFPTEVEDVDQTFGNATDKEARKQRHLGQQVITLTVAEGGPVGLHDLVKARMAEKKQLGGLLRGIGGAERKAANETRTTITPQAPARQPGLVDRFLRRTGAKQG